MKWMTHFFKHFDLVDDNGLTEYQHELRYNNTDNLMAPDSPLLPSHLTDKGLPSIDLPIDEGWRSRISRSTQPGKTLYTNPHQPSTWEKPLVTTKFLI